MSTLRVNKIVNLNDNGPVEFTKGATLPSGKTIEDTSGNSKIVINSSGIVTATAFFGDGSNITGITTTGGGGQITKNKALALSIIL
jgi:hypothetical protein